MIDEKIRNINNKCFGMRKNIKYRTIYADPTWAEYGGGKIKRGADRHYSLMKTNEIIAMSNFIESISEDNAHLYLWVTNNFMQDGLDVMKAWGFKYKTCITWMKPTIGLGQYFRGTTEHCLFGVKGVLPYKILNGKRQQGKTGFTAPKHKHSAKPSEMRAMIETVSYEPYIELFARERFEKWDAWGNESQGGLNESQGGLNKSQGGLNESQGGLNEYI